MLRVLADALIAADNRDVTLLVVLDLLAASDCVDYIILPQRHQQNFGVISVFLQWLISFLSDRTQQTIYDGRLSAIQRSAGVCSRLSPLYH